MADSFEFDHPLAELARAEAVRLGHPYVGTEHLLLGMLVADDPAVQGALESAGLSALGVAAALERVVPPGGGGCDAGRCGPSAEAPVAAEGTALPYTTRAQRAIEIALSAARGLAPATVTYHDFLVALLRERTWGTRNIAAEVLLRQGMPDPSKGGDR